jgi:hypothetical protein
MGRCCQRNQEDDLQREYPEIARKVAQVNIANHWKPGLFCSGSTQKRNLRY